MKIFKVFFAFSALSLILVDAEFCDFSNLKTEDKSGLVFDQWLVKRVAISFMEEGSEESLMTLTQVSKCDYFLVKNLENYGIDMSSDSCIPVYIPWTSNPDALNVTFQPPTRMTKHTFVFKFELRKYFIIVTCIRKNDVNFFGAYVFIDDNEKVEKFRNEIDKVNFKGLNIKIS